MGLEFAETEREKHPEVVVDSSIKVSTQCTAAVKKMYEQNHCE